MLWGLPPASKGSVSQIPWIVVCNVWGVGPLSLGLLWGYPPAVWEFIMCLLWPYGLVFWGCTIPPWGVGSTVKQHHWLGRQARGS